MSIPLGREEALAESLLLRARELAHSRGTRWLEMRAATTLSRLWQGRGQKGEARSLLRPIYDWGAGDVAESATLIDSSVTTQTGGNAGGDIEIHSSALTLRGSRRPSFGSAARREAAAT